MRSVEEWRGKTDDTPAPPRVRLRVFDHYDGRCYLTGRKIYPGDVWHLEHIVALANGGKNIESNLAPALVEPHKEKTREDRKLQAKSDRIRKKHLGIKKKGRGFACGKDTPWKKKIDGSVVRR